MTETFTCAKHPETELVLVRLSPESEVDLRQYYICMTCVEEVTTDESV